MARFLDETGLKALWEKVKAYVASALSGYATTAALKEVQTTADGAQTAVGNMALSVDDGTLNWTDQEGVKTGYALGGLSEGDANALEALKSRMAMFEIVKTDESVTEKAEVTVDGVTYKCNYGRKYAFEVNTGISFRNGRDKWSVEWNDFSRFEPRNMTDMGYMFAYNKKLQKVDSGNWDTSKAQSMQSMFENCAALEEVDVKNWNTSACKNMSYMFSGCSALQSLDVSGWDVSNVTSMSYMILNCNALTTLIGSHTLEEVESGSVVALKGLKVALDLSATKLERASILAVIKGLADLTGGTAQTLTLGSTLKAKLTEDDIAIATAKNWVIA